MNPTKLAFVGAGRMATALARGFVAADLIKRSAIVASDASPAALEAFSQALPGARLAQGNPEAVEGAEVVILAVKPQYMPSVLDEIRSKLSDEALVVSIAAGFPLERLANGLGPERRIVRVMPNTPCLIGRGVSGYSLGEQATSEDGVTTARLLGAVGAAYEVAEPLLDAVTGLSGSGPAFVYTVVEALSDAGVRVGLPRPVALDLAARTVSGAAQMVVETGEHPAVLRDAVTSPGGTTAAGLAELDRYGLRQALGEAVASATRRAQELGSAE